MLSGIALRHREQRDEVRGPPVADRGPQERQLAERLDRDPALARLERRPLDAAGQVER